MEQKLYNKPEKVLEFKHISSATNEIVKYIDDRRKFVVRSLKTRWAKFNKLAMGGIEPNSVYTIAGISGSGKQQLPL